MVNPIINIPILSEMGGIGPLKREFTVGFTHVNTRCPGLVASGVL